MSPRSVIERLSRGVVLRRQLPGRFGRLPLYVTPEAGLRYWGAMSRVDPHLYGMAEELVVPGSIVWDVGANVGLFAFCAAASAGRLGSVLAIEPDPWLASLMARSSQNLSPYACAPVNVLCASASDRLGVTTLAIAERARAANHLTDAAGSTQSSGLRNTQPTVSLTLDSLLDYFPAPNVLKIDVETHEARVLEGAARLLELVRPVIWCEVSHENSAKVTRLLHDAGYVLHGAQERPHPSIERAWFHTLALPAFRQVTTSQAV
jgi:FkbM family methyltransferase